MVSSQALSFAPSPITLTPREFFPKVKSPAALDRGLMEISGRWFRAFAFETRRAGEDRSCPPRTVGYTAMALARGQGGLEAVGEQDAVRVCLAGTKMPDPNQSAKEKVVFCNRKGDTRVYQADRQNRSAALCSCGNATAAAAAMTALFRNEKELTQNLEIADGRLQMRSIVASPDGGDHVVHQSWCGISFAVHVVDLCGRRVALCTGTFNNYVIVPLTAAEHALFGLDEVKTLWEAARTFGFQNPLQSRLAAVSPGPVGPYASFYTCGRMHPGAPLTGLAALSLAAGQVDWLGELVKAGHVTHRRGQDAIPPARLHEGRMEIQFPAVQVLLEGL
jgi:hypothetical protein